MKFRSLKRPKSYRNPDDKSYGDQIGNEYEITKECQVCCEQKNQFYGSICQHDACLDCWREYLSVKIQNFQMTNMTCIACTEKILYQDVFCILKDEDKYQADFYRYDKFLFEQNLIQTKNIRWCPHGCGFGIIIDHPKQCPVITCKICLDKSFCSRCSEAIIDEIKHKCNRSNRGQINMFPAQSFINNLANFFQQITGTQLPIDQFRRSSQISRISRSNNADLDGFTGNDPSISSNESVNDFYQSCASSFSSVNDYGLVLSKPALANRVQLAFESNEKNSIAIQTVENENKNNPKRGRKKKSLFSNLYNAENEDQANQLFIKENEEIDPATTKCNQTSILSDKHGGDKKSKLFDERRRMREARFSSNPFGVDENSESCPGQMKQCPRCKTYVLKLKDGTCNHIYCGVCGCEFCWLCLREINSMHYLGPSGCTFWGREQWSVRRRILLVVGLAIGAPPFLAILSAIAIPGILIGFPIVIGRKVYRGFIRKPRHIRAWWTTFAVLLSIITAPLFAVLVTTISLIASIIFIYIYMPIASFTSYVSAKKNVNNKANGDNTVISVNSSEDITNHKSIPVTIEWDPSASNKQQDYEWDLLAKCSKASKFVTNLQDEKSDSLEDSDKIEVV